jgi:hypothetical protein
MKRDSEAMKQRTKNELVSIFVASVRTVKGSTSAI